MTVIAENYELACYDEAVRLTDDLCRQVGGRLEKSAVMHDELILFARRLPDGTQCERPQAVSVVWSHEPLVPHVREMVTHYQCVGTVLVKRLPDEARVLVHLEHQGGSRCYLADIVEAKCVEWVDVTERTDDVVGALGRRLPKSYLS